MKLTLSSSANRAFPKLYPYIESYSNKFQTAFKSNRKEFGTRVAILDCGILSIPPLQTDEAKDKGLWQRIDDGESFVDNDTRLAPWQFASHPHGTQIANIIGAIDPHCRIYVAKVTEGRHGILPDNVADVCGFALSILMARFSVYMALSLCQIYRSISQYPCCLRNAR